MRLQSYSIQILDHFNSMGNLIIPEVQIIFISDVLENKTSIITENNAYQNVNLVKERQNRLTTNNLIFLDPLFESITTVRKTYWMKHFSRFNGN